MQTRVCIVGGGPSGLLLSQLLHLKGIDNIVLEKHSRDYVLARIRAGVLEHGFAALMREAQCGERMDREGEIHEGFFIASEGKLNRVDLHKHSGGSSVVVYGQTELTRDLYDARDRMKGAVIHNAEDVALHDLTTPKPWVTYRAGDEIVRVDCDFVIGAAGFHGERLQPVDADRLLVADLVLESDVDVFAALQHLLGGLGVTGLVAVDHGDLEEARQERDQREGNEQLGGAPVRGRRPVEHGGKPPYWGQRLPLVVDGRAHRLGGFSPSNCTWTISFFGRDRYSAATATLRSHYRRRRGRPSPSAGRSPVRRAGKTACGGRLAARAARR